MFYFISDNNSVCQIQVCIAWNSYYPRLVLLSTILNSIKLFGTHCVLDSDPSRKLKSKFISSLCSAISIAYYTTVVIENCRILQAGRWFYHHIDKNGWHTWRITYVSQFEHPIRYFYDTNGNKWWQNSFFVVYEGDYLVTVTPYGDGWRIINGVIQYLPYPY